MFLKFFFHGHFWIVCNEDEGIFIINIVSCIENKRRVCGNRNDEECYWKERKADKINRLYEGALYGLELLERGQLRKLKELDLVNMEICILTGIFLLSYNNTIVNNQ